MRRVNAFIDGYSAECLTESIFTQGDTWDEVRTNVLEAVEGYYFDRPKPRGVRLHVIRDEVLALRCGCGTLPALELRPHRLAAPADNFPRIGTP